MAWTWSDHPIQVKCQLTLNLSCDPTNGWCFVSLATSWVNCQSLARSSILKTRLDFENFGKVCTCFRNMQVRIYPCCLLCQLGVTWSKFLPNMILLNNFPEDKCVSRVAPPCTCCHFVYVIAVVVLRFGRGNIIFTGWLTNPSLSCE
jgi:hypothetical protein